MSETEITVNESSVVLVDGRTLAYSIFGNPNGIPVFYFHGFPGSRLEGLLFDEDTKTTQYKLISVDRPGIGKSSVQHRRRLLDWPDDIIQLADSLNIEKFGLLGVSGGGPYALACAYKIPRDRLITVVIASGMGPPVPGRSYMDRPLHWGLILTRKMPYLARLVLVLFLKPAFMTKRLTAFTIRRYINSLKPGDRKLFEVRPNLLEYFIIENYEAFRQGLKGMTQDIIIFANDWGFELTKLPQDLPIYFLQGTDDDIIPVKMAELMINETPQCLATVIEGEGHFSVISNHLLQLFEDMKVHYT